MEKKFDLCNYLSSIRMVAQENHATPEQAVQMFVENLAIMREWYKGAPTLNYHELGQQWNKLLSQDKVDQKRDALRRLKGGN